MYIYIFQVLIALACDLELDSLPLSAEAEHKWVWFKKYCLASRVAQSLELRQKLPAKFCSEVCSKLVEICAEGENITNEYLDHSVFKQELDEQLLIWLNR